MLQSKTTKTTGVIHWNYSVNDSGQVLHKIELSNGKGILKTNLELIDLGIMQRFDARKTGFKVIDVTKGKAIK
jgi:hypothetical protein